MAKKLNAGTLRAIKAPAKGQREHFDTIVPGLSLRASQGGAQSWSLLYRVNGKRRRVTIGDASVIGLADAREAANRLRASIVLGANPAAERKEKRALPTLAEAFEIYLDEHAKPHKRSWRADAQLFAQHTPPAWRARRVDAITRNEVAGHRAGIGKRSTWRANAWARCIRGLYNFLADRQIYQGGNPATLRRGSWFKEPPRERFLGADEMRRLAVALDAEPTEWRAYFGLLLFTGLRRSELASAEWRNYDTAARTLLIRSQAGPRAANRNARRSRARPWS